MTTAWNQAIFFNKTMHATEGWRRFLRAGVEETATFCKVARDATFVTFFGGLALWNMFVLEWKQCLALLEVANTETCSHLISNSSGMFCKSYVANCNGSSGDSTASIHECPWIALLCIFKMKVSNSRLQVHAPKPHFAANPFKEFKSCWKLSVLSCFLEEKLNQSSVLLRLMMIFPYICLKVQEVQEEEL